MKIVAITQARIGSTRLPGKILKTINGESLLEIHLKRILKSKLITKLKVATTVEPEAEKIVAICEKLGIESHRGSVSNVLERFYETAVLEKPDWVVRLTSDCPLADPELIDQVISYAIEQNLDYASNVLDPTYPDGMDIEVFTFASLEKAMQEASLISDQEHVTPYIWRNSSFKGGSLFRSGCIRNNKDYSGVRLTVDLIEDFSVIEKLTGILGTEKPWIDYVLFLEQHPEIYKLNEGFIRNEGYEQSLQKDKTE